MKHKIVEVLGWGLLIVSTLFGAGAVIYLRFANIDMTETRLFVEFWPVWIGAGAGMLSGLALAEGRKWWSS